MSFPPPPSDMPPLPPSFSTATSPADERSLPGRVAVFFQVWWRSLVVAFGGGIVIAVGFVIVVYLAGERFEGFEGDESDGFWAVTFIAAAFGAAFGVVLGIAAGVVLGLLASIFLVPYRGRRVTVVVMRIAAGTCVAAFFGVLGDGGDRLWYVLGAAGVVGGVVLAPWLVGWYIRRAEPSPPAR